MLNDEIDMAFNYTPVLLKDIDPQPQFKRIKKAEIAKQSLPGEKSLCETMKRLHGRETYFSEKIVNEGLVAPTLTANGGELWVRNTGSCLTSQDFIKMQTFPQDYDFKGENVRYICGMSVPPVMIKRITQKLIENKILTIKEK